MEIKMKAGHTYETIILIFFLAISACSSDRSISTGTVKRVVDEARRNLIYVEGGSFMIGDVGSLEGKPYTTLSENNKPPVMVTLDSYSVSKYETTWGSFLMYLRDVERAQDYTIEAGYVMANKLPIDSNDDPLSPNFHQKPARSPNYREAAGYCKWLAKKTDLPFALPTEAQWEYAARNRGKKTPYATNDGTVHNDTYLQRPEQYIEPETPPSGNALSHSSLIAERRSVGSYPPSPLGLYDMTGNVSEWTKDWYTADAYEHMDSMNPKGPGKPAQTDNPEKTVRDWAGRGVHSGGGDTVFTRGGSRLSSTNNGFRCVVNSPEPIE